MRDPRLDKLANVLVEYSASVESGDLVRISGPPVALPLVEALYERVIRAGAHPVVRCTPQSLTGLLLDLASEAQLKYVSPLAKHEVQTIDVSIGLWADTNTKSLSRVDPARQAMLSAARRPMMSTFMQRAKKGELKWCGTLFPTEASAQDAEMSLRHYEDFVFAAGHLDKDDPIAVWRRIEQHQQKVVDFLSRTKQLRFQADNGTDVTVNVEGMTWINCCGHENFPDGEVFTAPNRHAADGGVNGIVRYHFPAVHGGREVTEIELVFEQGKVVKALAVKNQQFLTQMLDQDQGARYLGEVAIGTNYNITQYTKNTLFDEKIRGTFHMAVGASYPETGNTNESGLHWDMVCDLRQGGTICADGQVISRDGKFVFDEWSGE